MNKPALIRRTKTIIVNTDGDMLQFPCDALYEELKYAPIIVRYEDISRTGAYTSYTLLSGGNYNPTTDSYTFETPDGDTYVGFGSNYPRLDGVSDDEPSE